MRGTDSSRQRPALSAALAHGGCRPLLAGPAGGGGHWPGGPRGTRRPRARRGRGGTARGDRAVMRVNGRPYAAHHQGAVDIHGEPVLRASGASEIPGSRSDPYIRRTLIGALREHVGLPRGHPSRATPTTWRPRAAARSTARLRPSRVLHPGPSIFAQVDPSWRSYQEFMTAAATMSQSDRQRKATRQYYAGRHNPAASYSSLPVGAPSGG